MTDQYTAVIEAARGEIARQEEIIEKAEQARASQEIDGMQEFLRTNGSMVWNYHRKTVEEYTLYPTAKDAFWEMTKGKGYHWSLQLEDVKLSYSDGDIILTPLVSRSHSKRAEYEVVSTFIDLGFIISFDKAERVIVFDEQHAASNRRKLEEDKAKVKHLQEVRRHLNARTVP